MERLPGHGDFACGDQGVQPEGADGESERVGIDLDREEPLCDVDPVATGSLVGGMAARTRSASGSSGPAWLQRAGAGLTQP